MQQQNTDHAPPQSPLDDLRGELEKLLVLLTPNDSARAPLSLPELPRALNERYPEADASYRPLYERVLAGAVPQVFRLRNRWYWWRSDLPAIAEAPGIIRDRDAA